jgi:hypothetical protein
VRVCVCVGVKATLSLKHTSQISGIFSVFDKNACRGVVGGSNLCSAADVIDICQDERKKIKVELYRLHYLLYIFRR